MASFHDIAEHVSSDWNYDWGRSFLFMIATASTWPTWLSWQELSDLMKVECATPSSLNFFDNQSLHSLTTLFWHLSVSARCTHGSVVRIFMGFSWQLYCQWKSKRALEQWQLSGRQVYSELQCQGEFQRTFVSAHESNHNGMVTILVGYS